MLMLSWEKDIQMEFISWNIMNLLSFVGNTNKYGCSISMVDIGNHDNSNRKQWYYNTTLVYELISVEKMEPYSKFEISNRVCQCDTNVQ